MFAVGIAAFVFFYYAERVLSAIAKFLVYLLGEREGRGEMGERKCRGRERGDPGENADSIEGWGVGMHEN